MFGTLRFAKRVFRDLPNYSKLAYCLLRDDRVPTWRKAAFGTGLTVGLNPFINLPEFIPVFGELDALAVTLLSLRLFIASTPGHIVEEHRRLLAEERSVFDEDLRSGGSRLVRIIDTVNRRVRSGPGAAAPDIGVHGTATPPNERQINP